MTVELQKGVYYRFALKLAHLTLEQHTLLVGLWHKPRFTHRSRSVSMGLKAQMFRIYTEWLMTQVWYLKRSIHWDHSIVNEVPQLVCMQSVPTCIWKFGLDYPMADRHLLCFLPYLAPALVHNYSCIKFCTILWTKCLHLLVFCERGSELSLQVTQAQFVYFKLKVKVQQNF